MAPRALIVRWRKEKARRRKTQPKAFAQKAASGLNVNAVRQNASFQYRAHADGSFMYQRLEHYIKTNKPHHRILFWMFNPNIRDAEERTFKDDPYNPEKDSRHPKMAVELLLDLYRQQDESLAIFQWDVVVLEHSDYHDKWMYFRGQECMLIYRRGHEVFQSKVYTNPTWLKKLPIKKVEWVGEPLLLERDSLRELRA